MRLTGKDVWEVGTKMGWANGTYDPRLTELPLAPTLWPRFSTR